MDDAVLGLLLYCYTALSLSLSHDAFRSCIRHRWLDILTRRHVYKVNQNSPRGFRHTFTGIASRFQASPPSPRSYLLSSLVRVRP